MRMTGKALDQILFLGALLVAWGAGVFRIAEQWSLGQRPESLWEQSLFDDVRAFVADEKILPYFSRHRGESNDLEGYTLQYEVTPVAVQILRNEDLVIQNLERGRTVLVRSGEAREIMKVYDRRHRERPSVRILNHGLALVRFEGERR